MKKEFAVALLLAAGAAIGAAPAADSPHLESPAFDAGGAIPADYSCDGEGISPPLAWDGVPDKARSLALIVDDPDAPGGTFVHWVLYNLPASKTHLDSDATRGDVDGARFGRNTPGQAAYTPMCPPSGAHHYHFKLYALDTRVPDRGHMTKTALLRVMQGHIIGKAELVGTYRRH